MKRIIIISALFITSWSFEAYARGGPKYAYADPHLDDEIAHIYEDMGQDLYNTGRITSGTISNLTVSTLTYTTLIPSVASKVKQIIFSSNGTATTTTSSSYQSTNLTASITPTSIADNIVIYVSGNLGGSASAKVTYAAIFNGSTDVTTDQGETYISVAGLGEYHVPCPLLGVDFPASIASQAYTVKIRNLDGATVARWNDSGNTSFIVLVEYAP